MNDDPRCCGTGTCIINADGQCWCGQQWDGEKMCRPPLPPLTTMATPGTPATAPDNPPPPAD